MPRVRQLEVPSAFDDEVDFIPESTEQTNEALLALGDDSEEELVPNPMSDVTKSWLSQEGGLGCFAVGFQDILTEIARLTGTRISVIDDRRGIQVTGKAAGDVEDAMGKMTRIERPLVSESYMLLGDIPFTLKLTTYTSRI